MLIAIMKEEAVFTAKEYRHEEPRRSGDSESL
jgi:hypothetical protein